MADLLTVEIVTPDAVVYSEDVQKVTLPAAGGQIGVLPQHGRLHTRVVPGELTLLRDGREIYLAVGDGLAFVTGDRVSLVTDMAVAAAHIDEATVEEARQRAAARLGDQMSEAERPSVTAVLAPSPAPPKVKRRRPR